jgi:hypothetical protein
MEPGDIVVYTTDPLLYGRMLVLSVDLDRVVCEAIHGEPDRAEFSACELEPATRVKAGIA